MTKQVSPIQNQFPYFRYYTNLYLNNVGLGIWKTFPLSLSHFYEDSGNGGDHLDRMFTDIFHIFHSTQFCLVCCIVYWRPSLKHILCYFNTAKLLLKFKVFLCSSFTKMKLVFNNVLSIFS